MSIRKVICTAWSRTSTSLLLLHPRLILFKRLRCLNMRKRMLWATVFKPRIICILSHSLLNREVLSENSCVYLFINCGSRSYTHCPRSKHQGRVCLFMMDYTGTYTSTNSRFTITAQTFTKQSGQFTVSKRNVTRTNMVLSVSTVHSVCLTLILASYLLFGLLGKRGYAVSKGCNRLVNIFGFLKSNHFGASFIQSL